MNDLTLKLTIGLLSSLILVLLAFLKIYHDRIRDIKIKLSDKKYHTYSEVISTLFDLMNRKKGLIEMTDDQLLKRMMDIKRDLLLYGSDKIIRKFFNWEKNQMNGKRFWNWIELAALVRKDMGNGRSKIDADEILKSLLPDGEDIEAFKKELFTQNYYEK